MPQTPHVAILGSGIAGLTLGRCLLKKGIRSVIYERASSAPRNKYGITLQPWAYEPLLKALDMDEKTFRELVAVDHPSPNGVGRISTGDLASCVAFRANRMKLESILKEGQTVEAEHSLESARLPDSRSVELQFQDGKTLRPTQVIDTLGVHSQLRKSLLPDVPLEVHDFAVYSGKRYVTADDFASTYAPAFGNGNVLVQKPVQAQEPRLEITINDRRPNEKVSISYIYSRAARTDGEVKDPLHSPDRSMPGATEIPGEFYDEVSQFVKDHSLDKAFVDCFDVAKIRTERVLHWLMRTLLVPQQELLRLVEHGVIMIGDAAHAVPILGGDGANLAILDAIKLAETFTDEAGADNSKVAAFYEDNWQDWSEAVSKSKKTLTNMHQAADP